jgi:hypothetical protein
MKRPEYSRCAGPPRSELDQRRPTPERLERLRAAALARRLWERSTGPRTPEGKKRSASNGCATQRGEKSRRELQTELMSLFALIHEMERTRRLADVRRASVSGPTSSPRDPQPGWLDCPIKEAYAKDGHDRCPVT